MSSDERSVARENTSCSGGAGARPKPGQHRSSSGGCGPASRLVGIPSATRDRRRWSSRGAKVMPRRRVRRARGSAARERRRRPTSALSVPGRAASRPIERSVTMSATLVDGPSMERFSRPIASMSGFVSRLSPPSHSSTRLQSACSPAASPGPSATGRWARRIMRRTCGRICGCMHGRDDVPELAARPCCKGVEAACLGHSGHQKRVDAGPTVDAGRACNVVPGGA